MARPVAISPRQNGSKHNAFVDAHPYAGIAALGNIKTTPVFVPPFATNPHVKHAVKQGAVVKSYKEAEEFLGDRQRRKLASNVYVERILPHFGGEGPHRFDGERCVYCGVRRDKAGDSYAIVLYDTRIIIYHCDGTFEADNGGYNTPTTSNRCNQFGPRGFHFYHSKCLLHANGIECKSGVRIKIKTKKVVK